MDFCLPDGRLQPGIRFAPTDDVLVMYYLKRKVMGKRLYNELITEVDIYQYRPEDLPDLAVACLKKELQWFFFCPRHKKYGSGQRTNRANKFGYWKATGNDRPISYNSRTVAKIKTLVFHSGKPPKGDRTDWVMHEYKLDLDKNLADRGIPQDSFVLCKIFHKRGLGPQNGVQYGAPFIEEEWDSATNNDDHDHEGGNGLVVDGSATFTAAKDHNSSALAISDSIAGNEHQNQNASVLTDATAAVFPHPSTSKPVLNDQTSVTVSSGVDQAPPTPVSKLEATLLTHAPPTPVSKLGVGELGGVVASSTSENVQIPDYDDIYDRLAAFTHDFPNIFEGTDDDAFTNIFEGLEDLSDWGSGGGLFLSDLDKADVP